MAEDEIDLTQFLTFDGYMLLESSMTRVHHHTKKSAIAIISSQRGGHERTPEENNDAHRALRDDLDEHRHSHGFAYIPVQGGYVENHGTDKARDVRERSYMVIAPPHKADSLKEVAKKLGSKYNQDSVIFKHPNDRHASLVGTNDAEFPGKDNEVSVGDWHPRRIHEFFTILRKAREYNRPDKTDRKEHAFSFAEALNEEEGRKFFGVFTLGPSPTIRKIRLF